VSRFLALAAASAVLAVVVASPRGEAATAYRFRPFLTVTAASVTHVAAPRSAPGALYVVEQDGLIRVAVNGRLRPKPFLDLTRSVLFDGEERGMLSIAFHPGYARNRRFYVDYVDQLNRTRVVEYRATEDDTAALPGSARLLLRLQQPGPEHKGGQLAFGPDGRLYVGLGDGECCDDPKDRAQDMHQLFGKILRLDVSRPKPVPQIVALGLRNPWRFSFDRANGDLYIADVGAGLWEEVDYMPRGQLGRLVNYGWDAFEARAVKEDKAPNAQGRLVFPVYAYPHEEESCSVTGGFVYRGSAVPAARGRYFFGDYCSGIVWSLRIEGGEAADVRREPFKIPALSTFGEDARGELYAASLTGRIYKLAS
jgi:glucose/arabinose dehydrogenase